MDDGHEEPLDKHIRRLQDFGAGTEEELKQLLSKQVAQAGAMMQKATRDMERAALGPPDEVGYVFRDNIVNSAEEIYNHLVRYIQLFEQQLDQKHEIGARLVSFGNAVAFRISDIDYQGPDIITFYGVDDNGQRVQLIQNISQLNVLLIALKTLDNKPPRRIGFELPKHKSQEKEDE